MIPNTLSSTATATATPAQANLASNVASSTVDCNQCNTNFKETNLSFIFGIASLILEGRNHSFSEESLNRSTTTASSSSTSAVNIISNHSGGSHHKNNTDDEINYFHINPNKSPLYQINNNNNTTAAPLPLPLPPTTPTSTSAKLQTLFKQKTDIFAPYETAFGLSGSKVSPSSQATKSFRDYNPSKTDSPKLKLNFFNRFCDYHGYKNDTSKSIQKVSTTNSPQNGPHCDQFLRKIGLLKNENSDFEEHCCDMSVIDLTCTRWRAYCLRIESIVSLGEPVCIEVYLGPVAHKILLEQWIIKLNDQSCSPSMTLPSLSSAIRSQLYFSQISAWTELIKKSDTSIEDSGRLIYSSTTNQTAGDLIETYVNNFVISSNETPNSSRNSRRYNQHHRAKAPYSSSPRLNIFYSIKKYDSTASFLSKPIIHTFPRVNVDDNLSLTVCLKSLPRLSGGIPKIGQHLYNSPPHDSSCGSSNINTSSNSSNSNGPNSSNNSNLNETTLSTSSTLMVATTSKANLSSNKSMQPIIKFENFNNEDRKKPDIVAAPQMNSCDKNDLIKQNNFQTPSSSASNNSTIITSANITTTTTANTVVDMREVDMPKTLYLKENDENSLNVCSSSTSKNNQNSSSNTKESQEGSICEEVNLFLETVIDNPNMSDDKDSNNDFISDNSSLSHREKQLQKYRKRILKRDKKVRDNEKNSGTGGFSSSCDSSISYVEKVSIGTQTCQDYCMSCGSEKSFVCVNCHTASNKNSDDSCSEHDEVDFLLKNHSDRDNQQKSQAELLLQSIQRTPRVANLKKKCSLKEDTFFDSTNQKINNNHSSNNSENLFSSISSCQVCKRQKTDHIYTRNPINDCESLDSTPAISSTIYTASSNLDDQYKDLKNISLHKENYPNPEFDKSSNGLSTLSPVIATATLSSSKSSEIYREYKDDNQKKPDFEDDIFKNNLLYLKEEEQFRTPTSEDNLIKHQQNFELATTASTLSTTSSNPSNTNEPPKELFLNLKSNFMLDLRNCNGNTSTDTTPKENSNDTKIIGKILPRINLTEIFCKPSMAMTVSENVVFTAPLKLNEKTLNMNDGFLFGTPCNNVPVQKSFSAPSIVNPLLLSPRATSTNVIPIFKQRSRHLSDRSERSSFGSDEQFSDEDLETSSMSCSSPGCYTKTKTRMFNSFQRLPLLGNLEETLLQKRLVPKMKVMGFKALLGASGGFCPTQLTIPATAYFYEFNDDIMSTPYFCEVNLPRKGYTVPRIGTVQVTLLNPLGTVVRMFVVPYDLTKMPPWHCTFVRQRILAEANLINIDNSQIANDNYNCNNINDISNPMDQSHTTTQHNSNEYVDENIKAASSLSVTTSPTLLHKNSKENLGHFITPDQMKRLRYCIHLKFQTSRSGRLSLCKDIKLLVSRRTDCDTAAAHAKGNLESPNDFIIYTSTPQNPTYSSRQENPSKL